MIYFLEAPDSGRIKIGTTVRLSVRLKQLCKEYGQDLRVLAVADGTFDSEKALHRRFEHLRVVNEWFEPGDDLLGFIVSDGQLWDGSDEIPLFDPETMPVRLTIESLDAARIAASYQGLNLSEYASAALLEIAIRDIERGHQAHQARTQGVAKKKGTK